MAPREAARAKKPKAPAPKVKWSPVDVYKVEQRGLERLRNALGDARGDLLNELKSVSRRQDDREQDAKQDGRTIQPEELAEVWEDYITWLPDIPLENIRKGLDSLGDALEETARVLKDDTLEKAVRAFYKKIPEDAELHAKARNSDAMDKVLSHLEKAQKTVPDKLSGPGTYARLRDSFDEIAEAVKILTGRAVQVPDIKGAVDRVDPRQLSMFTASRVVQRYLAARSR